MKTAEDLISKLQHAASERSIYYEADTYCDFMAGANKAIELLAFTPSEILLLKKGLGAKRKALSDNLKNNQKNGREKYIEGNKAQLVKLDLLMIKLESI